MGKSFGYTILQSREINIDVISLEASNKLHEKEPSLYLCVGCGSCTGSCTVSIRADWNIRKTHTRFRRGETISLVEELKKCMFCGKCVMVCPRGVNVRNVIDLMKREMMPL